jgi:hypothetical protein
VVVQRGHRSSFGRTIVDAAIVAELPADSARSRTTTRKARRAGRDLRFALRKQALHPLVDDLHRVRNRQRKNKRRPRS